jgi:hypothetical protein
MVFEMLLSHWPSALLTLLLLLLLLPSHAGV